MRLITTAVAGVSFVLVALLLVPSAGNDRSAFAVAALIGSLVVLVTAAIGWRNDRAPAVAPQAGPAAIADAERARPGPPALGDDRRTTASVNPSVSASPAVTREAEIVALLAVLQDKGRLIDFLQDDISGYSDAQVGAAARVVHQGCKTVLRDYVEIVPVREENEGSRIIVAAGFAADEYRLVGRISGHAPFTGTLMHRGWKAGAVTLPRIVSANAGRLPTIAPAEVELR